MNDLQTKLSQFEATPPEAVWEKIAEALDTPETLSQRLYNYREQPSQQLWKKIESGLDDNNAAKVVPFTTRFRKPIRYAAAASIIAAVLVTTTLLLKRTEAGAIDPGSDATVPVKSTPVIQANNSPLTQPTFPATTAILKTKEETTVSLTPGKRRELVSPGYLSASVNVAGKFIPKLVKNKELVNYAAQNKYMVYSDDNGEVMKVPKNLFSLVNCPDGDGSCKERILKLRQKLSASSLTADFIGIVEVLRQLQ